MKIRLFTRFSTKSTFKTIMCLERNDNIPAAYHSWPSLLEFGTLPGPEELTFDSLFIFKVICDFPEYMDCEFKFN